MDGVWKTGAVIFLSCAMQLVLADAVTYSAEAKAAKYVGKLGRNHFAHRHVAAAAWFENKLAFVPRKTGRPVAARQQVLGRLRALPKAAFRASQAKPPIASVARPASLTAPAVRSIAPAEIVPGKPVLLSQKGDWSVFRAEINGTRTCFATTQPKDSAPRLSARKTAYFYFTSYRPGEVRNEITIKLGLNATPVNKITAVVDGRDYPMAAAANLAFAPDAGAQMVLLEAMRHGTTLVLQTGNADGSPMVSDAFSLLGLAAALKATDEACSGSIGTN